MAREEQSNSGHRGRNRATVATEEHWAKTISGHRGTVGTEEQCTERNNGHRGTEAIKQIFNDMVYEKCLPCKTNN